MRVFMFILLVTLSSSAFSQSENLTEINKQDATLVGKWILDLRPSPEADPYLQTLTISKENGKKIKGSFYGSPIKDAYINKSWDKLYFAFKTSDGSSDYFQSGYIIGDEIFGVSYCPKRNFVMPWTGKRVIKE